MSKIFMFGDGQPDRSSQWDVRPGNQIKGWAREDFTYAINVHQRAYGPSYTQQLLVKIFGTDDPTRVPSYAYGKIIAAITEEMSAGLPHRIQKAPLYVGRKYMS